MFHYSASASIDSIILFSNGWIFVDFFFVLSGFVIALSYGSKLVGNYLVGNFLFLRLARVYPLHFFILALMLVLECILLVLNHYGIEHRAAFSGRYTPDAFIGSIFFIHIFGIWSDIVWNGPSWSIAAEVWCYALFALALKYLRYRYIYAVFIAVVFSFLLLSSTGNHSIDRTYSFSIFRCIYGFGLGVIAFYFNQSVMKIIDRISMKSYALNTSIELIVSIAIVFFVVFAKNIWTMAGPPIFFIAVLVFAREKGALSSALRWKPLRFLGAISYSIYITHAFVFGRLGDLVSILHGVTRYYGINVTEMPGWMVFTSIGEPLFFLICVIFFSWLSWRFIEEPVRIWSRRAVSQVRTRKAVFADEHSAF